MSVVKPSREKYIDRYFDHVIFSVMEIDEDVLALPVQLVGAQGTIVVGRTTYHHFFPLSKDNMNKLMAVEAWEADFFTGHHLTGSDNFCGWAKQLYFAGFALTAARNTLTARGGEHIECASVSGDTLRPTRKSQRELLVECYWGWYARAFLILPPGRHGCILVNHTVKRLTHNDVLRNELHMLVVLLKYASIDADCGSGTMPPAVFVLSLLATQIRVLEARIEPSDKIVVSIRTVRDEFTNWPVSDEFFQEVLAWVMYTEDRYTEGDKKPSLDVSDIWATEASNEDDAPTIYNYWARMKAWLSWMKPSRIYTQS